MILQIITQRVMMKTVKEKSFWQLNRTVVFRKKFRRKSKTSSTSSFGGNWVWLNSGVTTTYLFLHLRIIRWLIQLSSGSLGSEIRVFLRFWNWKVQFRKKLDSLKNLFVDEISNKFSIKIKTSMFFNSSRNWEEIRLNLDLFLWIYRLSLQFC